MRTHEPRRGPLHRVLPGGVALLVLTLGCAGGSGTGPAVAPEPAAPRVLPAAAALETFDAAWSVIHETHFDTTFGGVDWRAIREAYRPRAGAAAATRELRGVIEAMLGELGESHFALLPGEFVDGSGIHPEGETVPNTAGTPGFETLRVEDRFTVVEVDPSGPAAGKVSPGWEVLEVDGEDLHEAFAPLAGGPSPLGPDIRGWLFARERLGGELGVPVRVVFRDGDGRLVEREIPRTGRDGEIARFGNLPPLLTRFESATVRTPRGREVAVIRFNTWMVPAAAAFDAAVDAHRDAEGFLVDLRGNLGGLATMITGVSGHFLDERVSLGTIRTRETELSLKANPRRVSRAGERVVPFAGPLAILVDGRSYSASEFFAGGMQALGRARVFGRPSPGGALGAAMTRLPNGDVLEHAISDFETADGTRLEGRGVIPDEIVPLRREDLLAGRDADLEAALRWIDADLDDRGRGRRGGDERKP